MIDAENILFSELAKTLREKYEDIKVYGEDVDIPSGFPCVTLVESNNTTHRESLTGDNKEHYVNLMYTVNVYSNKQGTGKQECKDIMRDIDEFMRSFGFMRSMNMPLDNYQRSISRRVARYTGILSEFGLIYKPRY